MSPQQIGLKAALALLPASDTGWWAEYSLRGALANLQGKPAYVDALAAGLEAISGASDADKFQAQFRLVDSSMMQAHVLDSARRCFVSLGEFARAGFCKQWPQFAQYVQ